MSPSRRAVVVAVLLLGLAVATPAADAGPLLPDGGAQAAAKKKCKKGKVRMKVGKKKARCVAARKALPKPKRVDVARSAVKFVLGTDVSKLRDRRGRKLPSLPRLLDGIHPRADKALAAAAVATMPQFEQSTTFARAAAAPCGGTQTGSTSSTFDAGGGLSVDVRATVGPDAALQLGMESRTGTRRVRFEVEFPSCSDASLDSCPTAEGIVRGRDDSRVSVRATVTEGDRVVWSQGMRLQGDTTFRGVVGDDAKLQKVEVHNTEVATLSLGGDSRGFEISIRTLIQRITTVTMPGGDYQLGASIVNADISGTGISEGERRAAKAQIEGDMRREADKQFRDIVKKAIDRYKTLETQWNEANRCASIAFTPAENSRTLRRGDTGRFDARVQAKPGGSPPTASWTLAGAANAPFSPGTASSNPAGFQHGAVSAAGEGIRVSATLRAVSRAGVAEKQWWQPTEDSAINKIAGTFSGTWSGAGSTMAFAGDVTFVRASPAVLGGASGVFNLASGGYDLTVSGLDGSGSTGCQMTGTGRIALPANGGAISVDGTPPAFGAPYTYGWDALPSPTAQMIRATRVNCPDGAEELEGTTFDIGLFSPIRALPGQVSADGVTYSGTVADMVMTVSWSFTGTP